jgi:hypothetical protein
VPPLYMLGFLQRTDVLREPVVLFALDFLEEEVSAALGTAAQVAGKLHR